MGQQCLQWQFRVLSVTTNWFEWDFRKDARNDNFWWRLAKAIRAVLILGAGLKPTRLLETEEAQRGHRLRGYF